MNSEQLENHDQGCNTLADCRKKRVVLIGPRRSRPELAASAALGGMGLPWVISKRPEIELGGSGRTRRKPLKICALPGCQEQANRGGYCSAGHCRAHRELHRGRS